MHASVQYELNVVNVIYDPEYSIPNKVFKILKF